MGRKNASSHVATSRQKVVVVDRKEEEKIADLIIAMLEDEDYVERSMVAFRK